MNGFDKWLAEQEKPTEKPRNGFEKWMAEQEAPPEPAPQPPSYMDLAQAKSPIDIDAQIKENLAAMKSAASEGKRLAMPGDQPKAYAEGAPEARGIAMESARASAARAETMDEKATRELRAYLAGPKSAIPGYARMAGLWKGQFELAKQALIRATGRTKFTPKEIWDQAKKSYDEQFKESHETLQRDIAGAPEIATLSSLPVYALTPGGLPAKTAAGRVLGSTALGSLYGAGSVDRPGITAEEAGEAALGGATLGLAGGVVGEALRPAIRGAPAREDKAFVRELSRLEGGEAGSGLQAAQKEGLANDLADVVTQRHDPAIRAAVRMSEGRGIPIVQAKIKPLAASNKRDYALLDKELAKMREVGRGGLREPIMGEGTMTVKRLAGELEAAKKGLSPEAANRLDVIKQDLIGHWAPVVWGGQPQIKTATLRQWLTSVQDSAGRMPGSLNATKSYQAVQDATHAASNIVNRHFDSAAKWAEGTKLPAALKRIRDNNEQIAALSRIQDSMVVKAKKEKLEHMGLGNLMEERQRQLERTAALWSAFEGRPFTAAAIAAKPYVEKAVRRTAKWVNREILEPMQVAAENGATHAQLVRYAVERGFPQGAANYAATLYTKKYVEKREAEPEATQGKPRSLDFGKKLLKDIESPPPEGGDNTALMQTLEALRPRQ